MSQRHRRMRRGGIAGTDSLDLLLGPMCNTFGGIVLMAVVLALLTREVDQDTATTEDRQMRVHADMDTAEMLERRIVKADEDLAKAKAFEQTLRGRAADPALSERLHLAAERLQLRSQLDAIQPNTDAHAKAPTTGPDFSTEDPGVIAASLKQMLNNVLHQALEQENARVALDENLARLRRSQTDLANQLQTEKDQSVKKLRLPKEQAKTKPPFFVILRYGLVYPRFIFKNGDIQENEDSINVTHGEEDSLLEPRPGQGMDPQKDQAAITSLLKAIPHGEYYVAFMVYQDSFGTFDTVKQQVSDLGLNYGWDAFENDKPLIFSKKGRSVAPPL